MTEQLLDHAQVRAAVEQVRGERVAQRVRADPTRDAGGARRAPDDRVDRARAQATPARVHEDGPSVRRAPAEIGVERPRGGSAVRHHALLAALAEDAHRARFAIDRVEIEPGQLGDAQARGVEHLEDGDVARTRVAAEATRIDHGRGLVGRQKGHELSRQARRPDVPRGIAPHDAAAGQEAIETAHGRQLTRDGDRVQLSRVERRQPGADVAHGGSKHQRVGTRGRSAL